MENKTAQSTLLQQLRKSAAGLKVLYVEDSVVFRRHAYHIFEKIFDSVALAKDGKEGLALYKIDHHSIIITDIEMPGMNGLTLARRIKEIDPTTQIIIVSTYDEKHYLHEAIEIGIAAFLTKPTDVKVLVKALLKSCHQIEYERGRSILNCYLNSIFNTQDDLLILLREQQVVLANDQALRFFAAETLPAFKKIFQTFDKLLMPHNGFLYNHDDIHWFEEASKHAGKMFHAKLMDQDLNVHHFILKLFKAKDQNNLFILSLNDITELNLLGLFDSSNAKRDKAMQDKHTLINMLKAARENNAEIKVHNFYKGLTIANKGLIDKLTEEGVLLRTTFLQQKAIQYDRQTILESELFPYDIKCVGVGEINFEQQTVYLTKMRFLSQSPSRRAEIRVEPEKSHTFTLFYEGNKFDTDIRILDLSIRAVRIAMIALPAGFDKEASLHMDMILSPVKTQHIIINCEANVFRVKEERRQYEVVLMMHLEQSAKDKLVGYLAKRQMALIREFKGWQYGK